jgi:hypothetical protein
VSFKIRKTIFKENFNGNTEDNRDWRPCLALSNLTNVHEDKKYSH